MAKAIEAGLPKARIEEAAARTQARIDAGQQALIGVNRFRPADEPPLEVLRVDNSAVRAAQVDKLKRLRAERDESATKAALAALTAGARGNGNLLALCIDAARAKATVGEMSAAMESVFGRFAAEPKAISGVYASEMGKDSVDVSRVRKLVATFAERDGRPPRILVAKVGQDGHDRGQKVIASAFADLGFDVAIGPLFQTPEEAAALAIEKDVHVLGVSSLAAGHLTLIPAVKQALESGGRPDIMVVVGGIIPAADHAALRDAGAAAIFPPGTVIADAAAELIRDLNQRLGYEPADRRND
jgi:methylmalonyl-CoA mutase